MGHANADHASGAPRTLRRDGFGQRRSPGIAVPQPNNVERSRGHARQQKRGFIRFGARIAEEAFLQLAGRDLSNLLRQGHHGLGRIESGDVLQPIDLRLDFRGDLGLVCPTEIVRMPPKKSRYLRPSRSQTYCMCARSATSGCS